MCTPSRKTCTQYLHKLVPGLLIHLHSHHRESLSVDHTSIAKEWKTALRLGHLEPAVNDLGGFSIGYKLAPRTRDKVFVCQRSWLCR